MNFYRYEYGSMDGFEGPSVKLVEMVFEMDRETPAGYWIKDAKSERKYAFGWLAKPKWVSKTSRKRYAYPTKKEALESLEARTSRRIQILKSQIKTSESALRETQRQLVYLKYADDTQIEL